MDMITVSAKTLDDAITKALIELETTSDNLYYEVVEKGSSGILGIFGSKPAVIRARKKTEDENVGQAVEKVEEIVETVIEETIVVPAEKAKTVTEEKSIEKTAEEFLKNTFTAMDMSVTIETSFDDKEKELSVNLIGDDMGILIGKRGQTLDSLQYLVSLVVNKDCEGYIRVKLDTENYRERRKVTLETLAKNIAYKVKRTKRPVSLEPMNPYERRIIHAALQNDKYVMTRSEGEEPFRHVIVYLKKEARENRNYQRKVKTEK